MPQVSRIKLNRISEQELLNTLDLVLAKLSKIDDMQIFLSSLLTPTERLMLAKRLAIIILIKEGLTESSIAQTLHVTRVTVSRMQFFLEARGKGYELAIDILENEKILNELKSMLLKLASYSARAAGGRM